MEVDSTEWDAMCRICLKEGTLHSLFDFDDEKSELNIAEKIMLCSPIEITTDGKLPEQICTDCLVDLDVAYRFRKKCERSDAILQSFVDSSLETITEDYVEQEFDLKNCVEQELDLICVAGTSKNRVVVSSDAGDLYEYCPPVGLNVKLVKNAERTTRSSKQKMNDGRNKRMGGTQDVAPAIILKTENLTDDMMTDGDIDVLYDSEMNYDDSIGGNVDSKGNIESGNVSDSAPVHIKPVRTNKVRLGYTSANKGKVAVTHFATKIKQANQSSKENTSTMRTTKTKTNARGEPKPPKKCEICGNTYMYQHALESHMRRHRNEKPFKCSVCNKGFVINFELSRHMRTHTGQKPYACKYCDRKFSDFGSRVKHERIHTGERPYACATCGKTFAYSHVLSSHNLIHSGEKKYHCEVCGKRFAKSHHLKAHMNTHNKHKNQNNQTHSRQQQIQPNQEHVDNPQVYTLQVIDDRSQMDGDAEGDIIDYLSQANIITTVKESGSGNEDEDTSEAEGQLLLYDDVDFLDPLKNSNVKRKYVTTKGGQLHEITITEHQDPTELLTFEDDELE